MESVIYAVILLAVAFVLQTVAILWVTYWLREEHLRLNEQRDMLADQDSRIETQEKLGNSRWYSVKNTLGGLLAIRNAEIEQAERRAALPRKGSR